MSDHDDAVIAATTIRSIAAIKALEAAEPGAGLRQALADFKAIGGDLWNDLGHRLTCSEVEAFCGLLVALDNEYDAGRLALSHCLADDQGDEHFDRRISEYAPDDESEDE